jgi:hypothetical protein
MSVYTRAFSEVSALLMRIAGVAPSSKMAHPRQSARIKALQINGDAEPFDDRRPMTTLYWHGACRRPFEARLGHAVELFIKY